MKFFIHRALSAGALLLAAQTHTNAATVVFDNKSAFLSQTGAAAATSIPTTPPISFNPNEGFTSGSLSFSLVSGSSTRFAIVDASSRLPDNELTLSGDESFDVVIAGGQVFSFGFDFVEPETDPGIGSTSTFRDSVFGIVLKNGTTIVDSLSFTRPNDSAEFVGIWTDSAGGFDRIEIRETNAVFSDNGENEFFGQFYTGSTPVPEPSGITSLLFTLLAISAVRRRNSRERTV